MKVEAELKIDNQLYIATVDNYHDPDLVTLHKVFLSDTGWKSVEADSDLIGAHYDDIWTAFHGHVISEREAHESDHKRLAV